MKSLAVSKQEKILNLQEFFNRINVSNNQLINIKQNIIQLFNELVENKIIQNELQIVFKNGKQTHRLVKNLMASDITRRVKYIKLTEICKKVLPKKEVSDSSKYQK